MDKRIWICSVLILVVLCGFAFAQNSNRVVSEKVGYIRANGENNGAGYPDSSNGEGAVIQDGDGGGGGQPDGEGGGSGWPNGGGTELTGGGPSGGDGGAPGSPEGGNGGSGWPDGDGGGGGQPDEGGTALTGGDSGGGSGGGGGGWPNGGGTVLTDGGPGGGDGGAPGSPEGGGGGSGWPDGDGGGGGQPDEGGTALTGGGPSGGDGGAPGGVNNSNTSFSLGDGYALSTSLNLPEKFLLEQNYPNPFNPETTIRYRLPADSKVLLEIYNLRGMKIRTLMDCTQPAGYYSIRWNSLNDSGHRIPSGTYVYRIVIRSSNEMIVQTKKMLLVK